MSIFQSLKPGIPKRYLMFVAAIVWTFAGGVLLFRGINSIIAFPHDIIAKLTVSLTGGTLFYLLLFKKISNKHIQRIKSIEHEKPCVFAFFNVKSYIMMISMITISVMLRRLEIIEPDYFYLIFITMGVPLSFSAVRFYNAGIDEYRLRKKLSA